MACRAARQRREGREENKVLFESSVSDEVSPSGFTFIYDASFGSASLALLTSLRV